MKMIGFLECQILNYFLWIFFSFLILLDFELTFYFEIVLIFTFEILKLVEDLYENKVAQNILTDPLCIFHNITFG